jgi:diacylglycerol kinase family enzyme
LLAASLERLIAMTGAPIAAASPARLLVILNPSTGRYTADGLTALLERELNGRYAIQLLETRPDSPITEMVGALADETTVVLACGGDGTVSSVAAALVGRSNALAILPAGTTNIIAQGLGIPADPLVACQVLRGEALTVAIDVAQVGDRYILHIGGAGYDAQVMAMTSRAYKRGFGLSAYLLFGARGLLDQPIVEFTIRVDNRIIRERGWMALVANGGDVAFKGVRVGPDISSTDGLLDLVLFTAPSPWDALVSFASIATRRYRSPYLRYERGKQIEIHADPPLPVEFDGDPSGTTPFIAEVRPLALNVLIPSRNGGVLGPWIRRNLQSLIPPQDLGLIPPEY